MPCRTTSNKESSSIVSAQHAQTTAGGRRWFLRLRRVHAYPAPPEQSQERLLLFHGAFRTQRGTCWVGLMVQRNTCNTCNAKRDDRVLGTNCWYAAHMPADAAMSSHHIKAVVERVSWNVLAATIATMLHAPHTRPLASMPAVPPDLKTTTTRHISVPCVLNEYYSSLTLFVCNVINERRRLEGQPAHGVHGSSPNAA